MERILPFYLAPLSVQGVKELYVTLRTGDYPPLERWRCHEGCFYILGVEQTPVHESTNVDGLKAVRRPVLARRGVDRLWAPTRNHRHATVCGHSIVSQRHCQRGWINSAVTTTQSQRRARFQRLRRRHLFLACHEPTRFAGSRVRLWTTRVRGNFSVMEHAPRSHPPFPKRQLPAHFSAHFVRVIMMNRTEARGNAGCFASRQAINTKTATFTVERSLHHSSCAGRVIYLSRSAVE